MIPYIDMSIYDQGGCLHDLFAKKAAEVPNKIAVVTADNKKVKNKYLKNRKDNYFLSSNIFRLHFLS